MNIFDSSAHAALGSAYPEQPTLLSHGLTDHPLLRLDSLAGLAQRMRSEDVEYYPGDTPFGVDPRTAPGNGLSVVETIRRIEECGSWMVLKFVEQDEAYCEFLLTLLAPLEGTIGARTGPMMKPRGFIFITSPNSVTPLHFDPEHNILLQVRGTKKMTIFPPDDQEIVPTEEHERYHAGGHRNLPWREELADHGQRFDLEPGRAVHVPFMAPHWVQNGPGVSVSFSITWRSQWSYREEYAHRMNGLLRRAGLRPAPPKRFPHQNHLKSLSFRVIDRARRVAGLER
jgi:hypothetical protein